MLRFLNGGRIIVVFLGVFMLASCAHSPKVKRETKVHKKVHKSEVVEQKSSVTGSVLDSQLLVQGGNIALVPFKAGPNAEATDELDRLSLMIIKGIQDSLEHQKTSLHVVDAADGQPKIALQGYIEEYSKTGNLSRMMMRPNKNSLSLVGEVWLISNGQRLLNFSTDKKFNPKKEKPMDVAYVLGKEIGDYIGSYAQ